MRWRTPGQSFTGRTSANRSSRIRLPITGDQPAICPLYNVTRPVRRRPADGSEQDQVRPFTFLFRTFRPVARAVLEVVLPTAGDLFELELKICAPAHFIED